MAKYIIVGKAASGKDHAQSILIKKGFKPLLQYTSRPMRPNETGKEYHFTSVEKIEKMIDQGKFASIKNFNSWYYGFTIDEFLKCDVAILSPGNIVDLQNSNPDLLNFATIIYLDIPEKIRKERLKTRYDGGKQDDSVNRRMRADKEDFKYFDLFDMRFVSNEEANKFINNIQFVKNNK